MRPCGDEERTCRLLGREKRRRCNRQSCAFAKNLDSRRGGFPEQLLQLLLFPSVRALCRSVCPCPKAPRPWLLLRPDRKQYAKRWECFGSRISAEFQTRAQIERG